LPGFFAAWVGLALLVVATIYEVVENRLARRAIQAEVYDVQ